MILSNKPQILSFKINRFDQSLYIILILSFYKKTLNSKTVNGKYHTYNVENPVRGSVIT